MGVIDYRDDILYPISFDEAGGKTLLQCARASRRRVRPPLITSRLPGFASSQPATSPKSACNFGPAAKTAYWRDPASMGCRCSG